MEMALEISTSVHFNVGLRVVTLLIPKIVMIIPTWYSRMQRSIVTAWMMTVDGSLDEEDAVDKSEWFEDVDGDGFGNGGVNQFACNQPNGFFKFFGRLQ